MYVIYKYYIPKKKSPDEEIKIPPAIGVGIVLWVKVISTLSLLTFNTSVEPDLIKNNVLTSLFTEAVIDCDAIKEGGVIKNKAVVA